MPNKKFILFGIHKSDPDRIRTCDPQIRNLLLYPAELRNRRYLISSNRVQMYSFFCNIATQFRFFIKNNIMNPDVVKINPFWREALRTQFESNYFDSLSTSLKNAKSEGKIVFPPGHLIFHAYNITPPQNVKIVIIGQDPYHNPGEAMGLSFSVPTDRAIPPSLKNIYKELKSDINFLLPNHGDLTHWALQGVFLLNAILTVEKNNAGSHKNFGWQNFTDATISYLSEHRNNIVFMLWGNYAKNKKTLIDPSRHLVLESAHPSPLAGNAFQGCRHFSKANEYLIANNIIPIDWQL